MMSNNCKKCCRAVDNKVDDFIVCEGICAQFFHLGCVSLDVNVLGVLSKNIWWICDACATEFCRYREKRSTELDTCPTVRPASCPTKSIEVEINELKVAVTGISNTLAEMRQKTEPFIPHSTPISPLKLLDGTNERLESIDNQTANERSKPSSSPAREEECSSFSLYLTHIHRSATENDIGQLVSRSLAAPLSCCKRIVRLVSQWKSVNTMDYVSFRIELDEKWKPLALTPSTWPRGVKFREFVIRPNELWKPR